MAATSYIIRLASLADSAAIREIQISAGQAFRDVTGLQWLANAAPLPTARTDAAIEQKLAWVAESADDQQPVGFIMCEAHHGGSEGDIAHIVELSVRHDQQRRGIGRVLINTAAQAARQRNFAALTLTTFDDAIFNRPFYQRVGFAVIASSGLSERLRAILAQEAAEGLPIDRRCAMQMAF